MIYTMDDEEEIIREKYLENYPKPVLLKTTEKIVEQMKNNICKIHLLDGTKGTGFFCKISYNNNIFPALITNNHVINEETLEKENKILISMNQKKLEIELKNRIKYTNQKYDTTIIEIKENKDKINNFLELDETIINNESNISYIKETIYIIQNEGRNEEISVSYGILKKINEDKKYEFSHLCCTDKGSSGSPIFNLSNNKIIGIHMGGANKHNFNLGIFLNFPIQEFIIKELSNNNLNNNINNNLKYNFTANQLNILLKNKNNKNNNFFSNPLMNQNNNPPKRLFSNLASIKQFDYVPMIGLENIGQTSYMNSVLQCFSNLYQLTNYFLNPEKDYFIKRNIITINNSKATSLSVAYKELIENLWKGVPKTPFSPNNFKKDLGTLNSLFKGDNAGDAKDLAVFLIMQIHYELNKIDPIFNKKQKIGNQYGIIINPYNKQQIFNYFFNDFSDNHSSIISETFYGTYQGMFECQICKMNNMRNGNSIPLIKYNFENYFYLEFPLEEVRKFVFMQNNNIGMNKGMNYQDIDQVNIFDCFNYYQKTNEIEGYCEKCGSIQAKIFSVKQIFSPSHILMIILNRGKGLQHNIKINFHEKIYLNQIIINNNQYNNNYYELQSVIKYLEGENNYAGHFIAYCRSPIPKFHDYWFCYNDETVIQINNLKDIYDFGIAYILFYQLK